MKEAKKQNETVKLPGIRAIFDSLLAIFSPSIAIF